MVIPIQQFGRGSKKLCQANGQWIRTDRRLAIYLRDGFKCSYCKTDLKSAYKTDGVCLDHLIPRSDGGTNHESNLTTACNVCNCTRQNKQLELFVSQTVINRIIIRNQQPLSWFRTLARDVVGSVITLDRALEMAKGM